MVNVALQLTVLLLVALMENVANLRVVNLTLVLMSTVAKEVSVEKANAYSHVQKSAVLLLMLALMASANLLVVCLWVAHMRVKCV